MGWYPSSPYRQAPRELEAMWLLIVPLLFVGVLVVSTIFAGVFWVLGGAWPWLLIGLGMWLFWREDGRHHRARRHRLAWETGSVRHGHKSERREPQSERPQPVEKKRSATKPPKEPELPIDIQVKVEQI